ncbi:hypothetical protein ABID49_002100 [Bhargavaea ullalensis]|uniref:Uncharacterized protein n=1 Tax=Bhargavaea ullalensis TaxID=1265685 RepID=A0ABV2GD28_9BACL
MRRKILLAAGLIYWIGAAVKPKRVRAGVCRKVEGTG